MPQPPTLLIVGDSISIGYTPHLAELLAGRFRVIHHPGNATDSNNLDVNPPEYLAARPDAAWVQFNCGLHDIKRHPELTHTQVPLPVYRRNLDAIIESLQAAPVRPIWASTTPVLDDRHRAKKPFDRRESDVTKYNAAAAEIMRAHDIPINDLHEAAVAGGIEQLLADDGVHFTEAGYRLLAEATARFVDQQAGGAS